jgi:hypothetical protein
MIFRATQKVVSKLRIAYPALADGYPWMMEWYCNIVSLRRRQHFLFTHAPSLFSFWSLTTGVTGKDFGTVFRRRAFETLHDYGFSPNDMAKIIDDGPDAFTRATDRRIVGSMVDFAKMLRYVADDEGGLERLGSRAMNDIANDCPMSMIGMEAPVDFLRQILSAETPHNIPVHRTGARVARSGR